MKKVGIREAQLNLTKLLRALPFTITRFGRPIAVVQDIDSSGTSHDGAKDIPPQVEVTVTHKLCKHGSQIGLCKHGCKK